MFKTFKARISVLKGSGPMAAPLFALVLLECLCDILENLVFFFFNVFFFIIYLFIFIFGSIGSSLWNAGSFLLWCLGSLLQRMGFSLVVACGFSLCSYGA